MNDDETLDFLVDSVRRSVETMGPEATGKYFEYCLDLIEDLRGRPIDSELKTKLRLKAMEGMEDASR